MSSNSFAKGLCGEVQGVYPAWGEAFGHGFSHSSACPPRPSTRKDKDEDDGKLSKMNWQFVTRSQLRRVIATSEESVCAVKPNAANSEKQSCRMG